MPRLGQKTLICDVLVKNPPFWSKILNVGCLGQNSPILGKNPEYGVIWSKILNVKQKS